MTRFRSNVMLAALLAATGPVAAADILRAAYDPAADELIVEIAYRGTHAKHDFFVEWGPCARDQAPNGVVGRLIDTHGRDAAQHEFRTVERLSLARLPCRPAIATLRLGRVAHTNVYVPPRPGL